MSKKYADENTASATWSDGPRRLQGIWKLRASRRGVERLCAARSLGAWAFAHIVSTPTLAGRALSA